MPFQMALDEILFLGETERPALRFYFSSEPWVTVGYATPASLSNGRWPVCRRLTGGGRVLHGRDLIFSLAAHRAHDESFRSVRVSYWKIHEAVKAALESLGESPRFYRCDENLARGADCFRFPIASDLELAGRKVAGGAQKRSGGRFLHQESVLVKGYDSGELIPALERGFCSVFHTAMEPADWEPRILRQAEDLAKEKYERASELSR